MKKTPAPQKICRKSLVALAGMILHSAGITVHASDVDVEVRSRMSMIYVESNGEYYTKISTAKHGATPIEFETELEISAGQDRIKRWAVAPRVAVFGSVWGWDFDASGKNPGPGWAAKVKSYGVGDRPTRVNQYFVTQVSQGTMNTFAVGACNTKAYHLRNEGQGDAAIFGQEHVLDVVVIPGHDLDYTNIADSDNWQFQVYSEWQIGPEHNKIVCMQWAGAQVQPVANGLQAASGVVSSSLILLETATANGACKVDLSGVIETNLPNTEVKFRYEHTGGEMSDVKTVSTDHSKTAMFSHEYAIPNNPNDGEAGSIRMVGVSSQFQSGWKTYDMECNNPSPQGLQAKTIPEVSMTADPGKTIMVDGQICPSHLLLHGLVKAGSAFQGKALFLGNGFLTALQDVNVAANMVGHVFAERALNWGSAGNAADTFAAPPSNGPAALKTQKVRIGFNLTNHENQVVAHTEQDWYSVTCKKPKVNPAIQPLNNTIKPATNNSLPAQPGKSREAPPQNLGTKSYPAPQRLQER